MSMTKSERRELDTLRMRVAELTEALANATVGDGLPWYHAHAPDPRKPMGYEYAATPHRDLRFYDSEQSAKDGRRFFDVRLGNAGSLKSKPGPQLLVMTEGRLFVQPHSSNVIAIELDRKP